VVSLGALGARFYKASIFASMVKLAQMIENHLAGILATGNGA